jgi:UDP-N-acetylmuramate: L-alanyl-gamma-D-glutamyl-meso-diaminopimelate ligase
LGISINNAFGRPWFANAPLGARVGTYDDLDQMTRAIVAESRPGDAIVVMSNGGFGGIHQKLLDALRAAGGAS